MQIYLILDKLKKGIKGFFRTLKIYDVGVDKLVVCDLSSLFQSY
jgi:hypothetical protein